MGLETRVFVFDINVWVDVACELGKSPTPTTRKALEALLSTRPRPDWKRPETDSLRCWLMAASGEFISALEASVCVSEYMLGVLLTKLTQPVDGPTPETRGKGWTIETAEDFIEDAVFSFARTPKQIGEPEPTGAELHPPLDYEDGMVLACAKAAGAHYLVTADTDFNTVRNHRNLSGTLTICTPSQLVAYMQQKGRRP